MIFSENRRPPPITSGAGFFGIMLCRHPLSKWHRRRHPISALRAFEIPRSSFLNDQHPLTGPS
jgi:hypothetical protein